MNLRKKSKSPIICGGVACVVAVACLTGAAVNTVINKVNDNADRAYAEAVVNVQNAQMAEWQAEQDRLAQLEKESISNKPVNPTDYTVGDIIMVDGKLYVISSSPTDSDETVKDDKPVTIEPSDKPSDDKNVSDGNEDKPIESSPNDIQDSVDVDNIDDHPYIGADYVTIDVDGNMVYLVKRGDTLTKISKLTGYSVQELAEYNHIENVNLIYTNQSIRIPASQEAIDYVLQQQNNSSHSGNATIEPVN